MNRLLPTIFAALATAAGAQSVPTDPLQQFVQHETATLAARLGGDVRLEVTIGALPSGLQLAPCAHIEPFLPSGARLWGRSRVGMRCIDGAHWSVLVPVTVKVFGPAWVASRPLPALQPIALDDLHQAEVEWTRESQGVATDASQIDNHVLMRPIGVGQPIPLAALRMPQVVGQGDPVKVLGQGRGFAIQTDGIALAAAEDGQSVRVRIESGRILTGTARAGRVVEVPF
jgi:flagella basal body P-ring formation protein FlgA